MVVLSRWTARGPARSPENWLSRMSLVYEGISQPPRNVRKISGEMQAKLSSFLNPWISVRVQNVKDAQPTNNDHCPLADGTNKIWNCPLFKNINVNDRYAAVRRQRLCYLCLGKGHAIKNCKVNACGINGFTKKHNRLLHSENQKDEGNHAVNMSAATISQSSEVTRFLQIVPVSIQNGSNKLNTYVFLDSGSTVSFIDQSVNEKLRA